MEKQVELLAVCICLAVPVWFALAKASYQSLVTYLRNSILLAITAIGLLILVVTSNLRVLGLAMMVPAVQFLILISAARLFEAIAGVPLQHVQIQAFAFAGRLHHAVTDYVASILAVALPLFFVHYLFLSK